MVKNLPIKARDTGSTPGPEDSQAAEQQNPCSTTTEPECLVFICEKNMLGELYLDKAIFEKN